ncbi:transposase [Methylocystis sp. L43]|nr:transposase [Methylocystis sp. L43]MBG0807633.1 transposase [Methylocystis sp. H15]
MYAMRRFACKLRNDIHAVRNAVAEPWSNGQTEGQINRLKNAQAGHVWPQAPNCYERV